METIDLTQFGRFDAVFCVGVLYHLPNPWELIEKIASVTQNLLIWTHYAEAENASKTVQGYQGMMYQEQGLKDPLSGFSPESFWPTLECLMQMLKDYGFGNIQVIEISQTHPDGPALILAASTRS